MLKIISGNHFESQKDRNILDSSPPPKIIKLCIIRFYAGGRFVVAFCELLAVCVPFELIAF